jgi:hypothetical protein
VFSYSNYTNFKSVMSDFASLHIYVPIFVYCRRKFVLRESIAGLVILNRKNISSHIDKYK